MVSASPTVVASTSASLICVGGTATLTGAGASTYTWNPGALTGAVVVVTPTIATTIYTVTGANAAGCSSTATISINAKNNPTVTASASPSIICSGGSSTLTAGGGITYTWNPGALSGTTVVVTPVATTIYTVTGVNASGCTDTQTVSVTVSTSRRGKKKTNEQQ